METFEESVGSAERPGPYDVSMALLRPCPNCGAPEGVRCSVETLHGTAPRRMPCLVRLKRGDGL